MQPKQITRQHIDHQHKMTLSTPRRDSRQMNIPEGTFSELEGPNFSLPFRYLRTWLFSLIALIALPLGLMMLFVGVEIQENTPNWTRAEATVTRISDSGIDYQADATKARFSYDLDDFINVPIGGIQLSLTACDLVSRWLVPQEQGATFTVWINPDNESQQSCVPIDSASGEMYFAIGMVLLLFSIWRLVRTIHAAGLRPKKA